jgi:AcrR family transcriptional regulator
MMTVRGEQGAPAPLRADARRNREHIIEAARMLFIRIGPDVPMEDIARAAGVGVGTLYRRFPDRDQLIEAVSVDNFTRLAELAHRAERDEPDPAVALTGLLHSALELRLGIIATAVSARGYQAIHDSPSITGRRDEVVAVLGRLLRRAQRRGAMRSDIATGDVLLAVSVVSRLLPPADDEFGAMVFQRLFALMMDGLHAIPGSVLPGRPVNPRDLARLRQKR